MPKVKDPEVAEFEAALLRSVDQALAGEVGAVHTPEQIAARKRGRPAGSFKAAPKVSTNIRFDPDVLEALKATGPGWQTRVNDVMRRTVLPYGIKAEGTVEIREVVITGGLLSGEQVIDAGGGITLRNNIVVDKDGRLIGGAKLPSDGVLTGRSKKTEKT